MTALGQTLRKQRFELHFLRLNKNGLKLNDGADLVVEVLSVVAQTVTVAEV